LKNEATGFRRIIAAAGFSWQGLQAAYRHEAAFRQEVWLLLIAVPCAFWLADSISDALLLIGAVVFLLIVELLNSAVESVVDRIGADFHELAGRAKDLGSAAVFLAIGLVVVVWVAVLLPA